MARHIGQKEKVDLLVVELAALLHDIADWKFHAGDDTVGPRVAREILTEHRISPEIINHVTVIIKEVSFKGAGATTIPTTPEGKVVQDADRLDAMGAIGIARTFAYGGCKNRVLYNPDIKPTQNQTAEEYAKDDGHTINHFYDKLLLLKDLMNTDTGRRLAKSRHRFMEEYLDRFYKECAGKL